MTKPNRKIFPRQFLVAAFCTIFFLGTTPAHAALLTPVSVDGRDWLQPLDFINTSWNEVAAVCSAISGICSGELNGDNLDGWVWASVFDVQQLIDFFGPFEADAMFQAGFKPTESEIEPGEGFRRLDGYTRTLGSFGGADHLLAERRWSFGYLLENSI